MNNGSSSAAYTFTSDATDVTFNESATTDWESYPTWSKLVIVPRSTAFTYKYLKKDGSGNVTGESGTNRSCTTGGSSGYTTSDTWKQGLSSSTSRRRSPAPCRRPRWR
ncbi:carbohydrate-binding module family 20 domain-containing protein [Streptomyces sp. NPDC048419]|uniref:carbohydrate-binding module family 20 domain-containing protein n=1 Tax=Streptomyces sp. NPDC048419 TaxID=3365547 RepID=UPI0037137823